MENAPSEFGFNDFLKALKRRVRIMLWVAAIILFVAVLLAVVLPAIYRSQAIILIEQQEIPTDLVRSTVTSFADQRIQVISQRVMTSSNLFDIIDKYDLYEEERTREPREVIIENMREDIDRQTISAEVVDPRSGRPTEATIAFQLSYDSASPSLAQKVVSELVSLYLNENIKTRTEAAADTSSFLNEEAEKIRVQVADLEHRLAAFKEQNVDNRPEFERSVRESLNRGEFQLTEIDRRIHSAVQQRILYESELAQVEPFKPEDSPGEVSAVERLRGVEAQRVAAEAAYGPRHPDVLRLQKQAEAMRKEVDPAAARKIFEDQLASARTRFNTLAESYADDHPDVSLAKKEIENLNAKLNALPPATAEKLPNNPAYIRLKTRVESFEAEIQSLKEQRIALVARLEDQEKSLLRIPEVEAEYKAINREYESALAKYQEISGKQMEARLSESLESERKGEKFTLIEPPSLPEKPAEPNRGAILVFGLVLSIFGGLGGVLVAEALDTKIRGRAGVRAILTSPPLAAIPYVEGDEPPRTRRRTIRRALAAGFTLIVVILASVHIAYEPLDVLWFVTLRKLGL